MGSSTSRDRNEGPPPAREVTEATRLLNGSGGHSLDVEGARKDRRRSSGSLPDNFKAQSKARLVRTSATAVLCLVILSGLNWVFDIRNKAEKELALLSGEQCVNGVVSS